MNLLLAIMTMAVLFQPTTERFKMSLLYWFAVVGYAWIGDAIDAPWYYLGGAFVDLLVIGTLASVVTDSRLVVHLMIVSTISIILNTFGFASWLFYMPPTIYDETYLFLYGLAIILMTLKEPDYVGHHQRSSVWSRICAHALASCRTLPKGNHSL